ncbi:unnamed protein product [Lactuca virosa]|uniref:Uncharacterized protein n=1 Tax=Lactuca virosa TaxID=75947 RepID=A0AAU9PV84_9ASTR|nr:unnamed protein product [Lactuca virosa]
MSCTFLFHRLSSTTSHDLIPPRFSSVKRSWKFDDVYKPLQICRLGKGLWKPSKYLVAFSLYRYAEIHEGLTGEYLIAPFHDIGVKWYHAFEMRASCIELSEENRATSM